VKTKTFEAPTLYGDHHVIEVRRILLELKGVTDVYASSAFHVIEVTYDASKIKEQQITAKLEEAGYLGEWSVPTETGVAAQPGDGERPFFRHTTTYETTRKTISFTQRVGYHGRPLWYCPGIGMLKREEEADRG